MLSVRGSQLVYRNISSNCTRQLRALQIERRLYSSSCRKNDRSSNDSDSNGSSNKRRNGENDEIHAASEENNSSNIRRLGNPERLSFMPVVNMPQAEFAHNAFFSLHRPLLGLSCDEERPFFSSRQHTGPPNAIQRMLGLVDSQDEEAARNVEIKAKAQWNLADSGFFIEDEALAQYMMQLRPFEPPGSPSPPSTEDIEHTVTVTFEDGHTAYDLEGFQMEQTLPMYYMPESDEVVDYLTAMQDKLLSQQDEEEYVGRRRGLRRRTVDAALARKKNMAMQQRIRRQRPVTRLLADKKLK